MRTWKKLLSFVLMLTMLVSVLPVSAIAEELEPESAETQVSYNDELTTPSDMDTAPAEIVPESEPVVALEENPSEDDRVMLMGAIPDGVIIKDGLTRAEWMQDLVILFDMQVSKDEYPDIYFPDISEETTYFDAIMKAVKNGVVSIEAGDNFEPDAVLTREFAAQTLNYCLGVQNDTEEYTYSDTANTEYPDDAQVALDLGWFELVDGCFIPARQVTSDEISNMLGSAQGFLDRRSIGSGVAEFEFADYVKIIPTTSLVESTYDFEADVTTVTISDWNGTLAAGDTFAFYAEDYAFVYGVKRVVTSDGKIIVETEDAPAGAILNYEYAGQMDLDLTPDLRNNEPITLMSADGDPVYFGEIQLMGSSKHSISFSRDFTKGSGIGIKGKISGTFKDMQLDAKFIGGYKCFILSGKIEVSSTMELDLLDDPAAAALALGGVSLGPFGYAGLEINLKMEAKIGYTISSQFRFGIEYQNKTVSWVNEMNTSDCCVTVEGTVSAKLALAAHLNFGANGSATASIGVGPKMQCKLKRYTSGTPKTCLTLTGYLYAGVECKVKFKELLSSAVVFEYKYNYDFYTEKNSPIRVYTHAEDGVEVPSCTRSGDPGTEEPGYITPKYYTPSNSRYYGGGSNVLSGGYGARPVVIWETKDNDDGTVTITAYHGNASVLNIPQTIDGKTVTAIGDSVFKDNTVLRIVIIPDTVTKIGSSAFMNCKYLTEINLPKSLAELGSSAFENCVSLTNIEIPKSLRKVGHDFNSFMSTASGPFSGCNSLKNIIIENGATTIVDGLFAACNGNFTVSIPDTVTTIGSESFVMCQNLQEIDLPATCTSINYCAFYGCVNLKRVAIPSTLTTLGAWAFAHCISLDNIALPKTLKKVDGEYGLDIRTDIYQKYTGPFYDCRSLKNLTFEEGITEIPNYTLAWCPGIERIDVPDTVTAIRSEAFAYCKNLVIVTLPENCATIDYGAFQNCKSLKDIRIPKALSYIGDAAFANCVSITEVLIPKSLLKMGDEYTTKFYGPFYGCAGLEKVSFEDGIEIICRYLFKSCTGLKEIVIPNSVKRINDYAFYNCIYLESATISNICESLGNGVFYDCRSLKEITIPNSVTDMGTSVFQNCTSLTKAVLPNIRQNITAHTFDGCTTLTDIVLPDTVTAIRDSAFKGCSALETINYPDKLEIIEGSAFAGCTSLKNPEFPMSLKTIGGSAYSNCDGLTSVTLADSVTTLGTKVFFDCDALKDVKLSTGLKTLPDSAFEHCDALEKIILPYRITTVGSYAFKDCVKFKEVTIPKATTTIAANAFSYPNRLTIYGVSGTRAETYAGEIGATFQAINHPVTEVTLNKTELTMNNGSSVTLSPSITPVDFTDSVKWKTSNRSIATVTDDGVVKAVAVGSATITFMAGNKKATCAITVVQPVTGISLNKTSATLDAGETLALKATVSPNNAANKDIVWSTSDESIATVDQNGLVTALKKGSATITVTAQDGSGKKATCSVTVRNNLIVAKTVEELQSPHPYAENCNDVWQYSIPGAESLDVTFSADTSVEEDTDFIYILDGTNKQIGKYNADALAGKTIHISGDTVRIRLESDDSYCEYGFTVIKIAANVKPVEVTIPLATQEDVKTTLTPTDGGDAVEAQTEGGTCVFNGTPDGTYNMTFEKDGYVPCTKEVEVKNGTIQIDAPATLVKKGNINGAVDDGGEVSVTDMACLFTQLSTDKNEGQIQDEDYFQQVCDVNTDGVVNILDYQALYELVKKSA